MTRPSTRSPRTRRALVTVAPAAAILAAQVVLFPMPAGAYVLGVVLGLLGSLVAVGIALVHRASHILNFAQHELGLVPTVLAVDLAVYGGLNLVAAFGLGLVGAVVCGGLVELLIIRRFTAAPRLLLTVATIGISQLLLVAAAGLPALWDQAGRSTSYRLLDGWGVEVPPVTLSAVHVATLVLVPLALLAVGAFLRLTFVGVAIRASAERAELANLLGLPVRWLHTLVWVIAAVLSFTGVFLRAGVVGLPAAGQTSFLAVLGALAAVMVGGLTNLPSIALTAVAIGVMEEAVTWNNGGRPGVYVLVLAVIVAVGLLVRRPDQSRVGHDAGSSWVAVGDVRPVPPAVRQLPVVRAGVALALALGVAALVVVPAQLSPGGQSKVAALAIFAIIGISIVLLTGWTGQVSLGQFGFVAVGSVVTAYATVHWRLDLLLCLALSAAAGALCSVVVGLPALRLRGLHLAVVTLAFATAVNTYLLSTKYVDWIPQARFERRRVGGVLDVRSELSFAYLCLACLVVVWVAARGLRRSRTGRVLLALRENDRGASAFGVDVVRAKLVAFALSGALAAFAGGLLVYLQQRYADQLYDPSQSVSVFTSSVVGGVGSVGGALAGAGWFAGGTWFLPPPWSLLPSAVGVLVVLLALRGGIGGFVVDQRDAAVRAIARRYGVAVDGVVPADRVDDAVPALAGRAEAAA